MVQMLSEHPLIIIITTFEMGLLKDFGQILSYQESTKIQKKLQLIAAEQFIHVYELYHEWTKSKACTCKILWGDEIEGHRVTLNPTTNKLEVELNPLPKTMTFPLMLEYGRWMFEMIPSEPYKTECNFEKVVESLRDRYKELHSSEDIYLTIPSLPFLGVVTEEQSMSSTFQNPITQSRFIDDKHISDHVRFRTLTKNIRQRRGKTVDIRVPIYKDTNTNLTTATYLEPYPGYVYMDAMAFGMGMSCLQCTFSTKDITHARYIHDSLHVLSPLFLALTAGTPIVKGKLMDWDVRWNIIGDSVDDRTDQEKNPESSNYQHKSRYSSLSHYISNSSLNKPEYNDIPENINKDVVEHVKKILKHKDLEIDDILIHHLAVLLSREFLIVHEKFNDMTEEENVLFEMINSTNWNSVRFKIPIDDNVGWRVEFRTMEIQLTADENAAYNILTFIMVLMMHHISNLNFYIPISLVQENFKRAHERNAITEQKFYFRTNIRDSSSPNVSEMTLDEIFFGSKENQFVGLLLIFIEFFDHPMICPKKKQGLAPTFKLLKQLWKFLKDKVTGKTMTLAQWMRKFVSEHKEYKFDSVVTEPIWTDLIYTMDKISKGEIKDETFSSGIFEI